MNLADLMTKSASELDTKGILARLSAAGTRHLDLGNGVAVMLLSADSLAPGQVHEVRTQARFEFRPMRIVFLVDTPEAWRSHPWKGDHFRLTSTPVSDAVVNQHVHLNLAVSHDIAGLANFSALVFGATMSAPVQAQDIWSRFFLALCEALAALWRWLEMLFIPGSRPCAAP